MAQQIAKKIESKNTCGCGNAHPTNTPTNCTAVYSGKDLNYKKHPNPNSGGVSGSCFSYPTANSGQDKTSIDHAGPHRAMYARDVHSNVQGGPPVQPMYARDIYTTIANKPDTRGYVAPQAGTMVEPQLFGKPIATGPQQ